MSRKRDPNFIRALKGKKPRIDPEETVRYPIVPLARIAAPRYLTTAAVCHWERMSAILDGVKLLQESMRDKLGRYCQAAADYEEVMTARNKLGSRKLEVTEANWRKYVHWGKMLQDAAKEMKDFEQEFGLTPAAAARVRHPGRGPKDSKDPKQKFQDYLDEIPKV